MAKAFRLGLGLVLGLNQVAWLGLGLGDLKGDRLTLSHSLSFLIYLSRFTLGQTPNTIHLLTRALISPLVQRLFRVGSDVGDLLVASYAWTPSLRRFVEALRLGLVREPYFEVNGPYRTKPLAICG